MNVGPMPHLLELRCDTAPLTNPGGRIVTTIGLSAMYPAPSNSFVATVLKRSLRENAPPLVS